MNTYTPKISQISETLQKLTHLKTHFIWDQNAQKEFDDLKQEMTQNLLIHAFDPTKNIYIYSDAAKKGVGFILVQPTGDKQNPYNLIQAGSTHLNDAQSRYSIFQIELLAKITSFLPYGAKSSKNLYRPFVIEGNTK